MPGPVICIGAALIDELLLANEDIVLSSTTPATVTRSAGGVARNIAHQLALLGVPVQLVSVFGDDETGDWLKKYCLSADISLDAALTIKGPTGKYTGIIKQDGSLFAAFLSNTAIHHITPEFLESKRVLLSTGSFLLADANISKDSIEWLLTYSRESGIPFIIEPVSVAPARKLASIDLNGLYLITPNEDELPAISMEHETQSDHPVDSLLRRGVSQVWVHNGAKGSTIFSNDRSISLHARPTKVVDCTGAGDSSLSGFILGKYLGKRNDECLKIAHTLASEILQVHGAIDLQMSRSRLLTLVPKYFP